MALLLKILLKSIINFQITVVAVKTFCQLIVSSPKTIIYLLPKGQPNLIWKANKTQSVRSTFTVATNNLKVLQAKFLQD